MLLSGYFHSIILFSNYKLGDSIVSISIVTTNEDSDKICSKEQMELPPGFRFHPTDEELITHYLVPKISNRSFSAEAMGEVDLNKVEPWELPGRAKMGEKEWYFFCLRDRKYPTGSRTNRATQSGYWKATGKDKEIFKGKRLVGMKKTLVFYQGRAPRGEKTTWVMHEYRVDGKHSRSYQSKNEWVISRVFHKNITGVRSHISELVTCESYNQQQMSNVPTLLDISSTTTSQIDEIKFVDKNLEETLNIPASHSSFAPLLSPTNTIPNPYLSFQFSYQFPDYLSYDDQTRYTMEYNGQETQVTQNQKTQPQDTGGISTYMPSTVSNYNMGQRSYEDQEYPTTSTGQVDVYSLWNY